MTDLVDRDWLLAQLKAWPERVHPGRTTNIEFLMKSAAKALAELTEAFHTADRIACAAIESGFYVGDGLLEQLATARSTLGEMGER